MMQNSSASLIQQAKSIVRAAAQDPQKRLALRQAFYKKYGDAIFSKYGYGNSELAFLEWEIKRGVLNPLQDPKQAGSPWWRKVNLRFCFFAELASLIIENPHKQNPPPDPTEFEIPVQKWCDYIQDPSPETWYIAHNCSITNGYLAEIEKAKQESPYEQTFMNIVLYRLLYAQAMVEGDTRFGELGEIFANPKGMAVDLIVEIQDFYPENYPLSRQDYEEMIGREDSIFDIGVKIMDDDLILPQLTKLYTSAASLNDTPDLLKLVAEDKPVYPNLGSMHSPNYSISNPTSSNSTSTHHNPNSEPAMPVKKEKIAILGGGISALSTAFDLTSDPNWQERYEITLYQQGWRCGGKMTGGRGENGRVEELGLHLLLGWYKNAFPLFRSVYEERTKYNLAPLSKIKKLEDAIIKNNATLMTEYIDKEDRWINWPLVFPENNLQPGGPAPLPTKDLIKKGIGIMLETILGSPYQSGASYVVRWILDHFFPENGGDHLANVPAPPKKKGFMHQMLRSLNLVSDQVDELIGFDFMEELEKHLKGLRKDGAEFFSQVLYFMDKFFDKLQQEAERTGLENNELRRLYILTELGICLLRALLADVYDPKTGHFNYRNVNDIDFRLWLKKYGCSEMTLYSPMVEFFYTGTFEALDDHNQKGGLLAASTALQFFLPALGYKGSFCYQLTLGTTDTLITPLYQVLENRGVKFEFFHRVINIKSNASEDIQEILCQRQVDLIKTDLKKTGPYQPLITVQGNPSWPSHPLWDQINAAQAEELRLKEIDLESPWADWQGVGEVSLKKGVDFDQVFLGIPVKALKDAAPDLVAEKPQWKAMVENIGTAQVMSAQFWLKPNLKELGFILSDWGMGEEFCVPNVVTYQNPMFSWLDSTYIIANEEWPKDNKPQMLAQFTGILPDSMEVPPYSDHDFPKRELERVKYLVWQWTMDNMGFFFKKARTRAYQAGMDLSLLATTDPSITDGREKFEAQYFKAAVAPSDQYTIALPDTDQYRLKPDGSLYGNLYLVGDWTDYGTNIGYMEGCIISSYTAVQAYRTKVGISYQTTLYGDDD